jgi:hypothetical protein
MPGPPASARVVRACVVTACSLAGGAASAAPASAARLTLHRVATATGSAVASATSERYAYLAAPGRLVVRSPGGTAQPFEVPAACWPGAITAGLVALTCDEPQAGPRAAVLRLDDGNLSFVPVQNTATLAYQETRAIGQHWLRVAAAVDPFGSDPHALSTEALVDRVTGRIIRLDEQDPFPVSTYPDLDRADPARPLCRPIRRQRARGLRDGTKYQAVTRVGPWVLQGNHLQRCGARTSKFFPLGYKPRLGVDALGYGRTNDRRQIVYRDLRSRRTWIAPWPGDAPDIAMTSHRLIVSLQTGEETTTIYETTRAARR